MLAFILAVGTVLRCWGIQFGLPLELARPDEEKIAQAAFHILQGDFNPHFFLYPSLFIYLTAAAYAVLVVFERVLGTSAVAVSLAAGAMADPSLLHLVARGLAAASGIATIVVLYGAASELFPRRAALAAAAFLAIAFLHVRDSHFGVTDVPVTLLTVCAFWGGARIATRGVTLSRSAVTGLLCGLAASTKYNAALIALPALVAIASHGFILRRVSVMLALAAAVALAIGLTAGFLGGTPFAVLDRPAFLADIEAQRVIASGGWTWRLDHRPRTRGVWRCPWLAASHHDEPALRTGSAAVDRRPPWRVLARHRGPSTFRRCPVVSSRVLRRDGSQSLGIREVDGSDYSVPVPHGGRPGRSTGEGGRFADLKPPRAGDLRHPARRRRRIAGGRPIGCVRSTLDQGGHAFVGRRVDRGAVPGRCHGVSDGHALRVRAIAAAAALPPAGLRRGVRFLRGAAERPRLAGACHRDGLPTPYLQSGTCRRFGPCSARATSSWRRFEASRPTIDPIRSTTSRMRSMSRSQTSPASDGRARPSASLNADVTGRVSRSTDRSNAERPRGVA